MRGRRLAWEYAADLLELADEVGDGRISCSERIPTGRCEMPTPAQLAMKLLPSDDTRCEALFASVLQPSDTPTAEMVTKAIDSAVQQLGIGGCIGRMAQEFGDHPETAATRMRWVRQLTAKPSGT